MQHCASGGSAAGEGALKIDRHIGREWGGGGGPLAVGLVAAFTNADMLATQRVHAVNPSTIQSVVSTLRIPIG